MNWYNEPSTWRVDGGSITVQTEAKTDFWRLTSYGYTFDSGHFYAQEQIGDFQAEVKCSGNYAALYDQAGLMVRVDEANWIKCGIEFLDGVQHVSAVVTREYSDWSIGVALPDNPPSLWLRVKRQGAAIEISYALDGSQYKLLRLAYLSPAETMQVGPMCASPEGTGFTVTFEDFTINTVGSDNRSV